MAATADARSIATPLRGVSPRLPRAVPEPATIGICCLSGRVDEVLLAMGANYLRELGHQIVVAEETLHAWRYFAGTDDERLAGFHRLLEDPTIDMILMARGGYGLSRVLHRIDWSRVAASGKAFVGFSDFTAFNMAAYACANLVTYHGPMLTSDFAKDEPDSFAMQHFWMAVSNESHRIDDVACSELFRVAHVEYHRTFFVHQIHQFLRAHPSPASLGFVADEQRLRESGAFSQEIGEKQLHFPLLFDRREPH